MAGTLDGNRAALPSEFERITPGRRLMVNQGKPWRTAITQARMLMDFFPQTTVCRVTIKNILAISGMSQHFKPLGGQPFDPLPAGVHHHATAKVNPETAQFRFIRPNPPVVCWNHRHSLVNSAEIFSPPVATRPGEPGREDRQPFPGPGSSTKARPRVGPPSIISLGAIARELS